MVANTDNMRQAKTMTNLVQLAQSSERKGKKFRFVVQ